MDLRSSVRNNFPPPSRFPDIELPVIFRSMVLSASLPRDQVPSMNTVMSVMRLISALPSWKSLTTTACSWYCSFPNLILPSPLAVATSEAGGSCAAVMLPPASKTQSVRKAIRLCLRINIGDPFPDKHLTLTKPDLFAEKSNANEKTAALSVLTGGSGVLTTRCHAEPAFEKARLRRQRQKQSRVRKEAHPRSIRLHRA